MDQQGQTLQKMGQLGREMGFKINGLDTRDPSPLTEGEIYYLLTLDHYFLLNFIFRGSPGPVEFFSLQIKRGVFSNVRTYQLWKIMSLSSSRKAFYFWIIVVQDTSSLKSTTPRLQIKQNITRHSFSCALKSVYRQQKWGRTLRFLPECRPTFRR